MSSVEQSQVPVQKPKRVYLTEEQKASDPKNFIYNPATKKYVGIRTETGVALAEGRTVVKKLTETERANAIVEALQNAMGNDVLTDQIIDGALRSLEIRGQKVVYNNFPKKWGGSAIKHRPKPASGEGNEKPKGVRGPFIWYCQDYDEVARQWVEANPSNDVDKNGKPLTIETKKKKRLGVMWAQLKDDVKAGNQEAVSIMNGLKQKTNDDRVRNAEEMTVWEAKPENQQFARKTTQKIKSAKIPQTTGWQIFCKEKREEVKANNPGVNVNSALGAAWKLVPPEEKAELAKRAEEINLETIKNIASGIQPPITLPTPAPPSN